MATITPAVGSSSTGGGTSAGTAGGVLSGSYPNPGFATDMATQAELNAVAASAVTSTAFDVIVELDQASYDAVAVPDGRTLYIVTAG